MFNILLKLAVKAPYFLAKTNFNYLTKLIDSILQYALQTKLDFYYYLASKLPLLEDFNLVIAYVIGAREY